jgi:hypothetical protein
VAEEMESLSRLLALAELDAVRSLMVAQWAVVGAVRRAVRQKEQSLLYSLKKLTVIHCTMPRES